MKKSGFTLIELLAVIVILAVIALITVPAVMNVVSDARKSAAKDAAYGYVKAIELSIALENADDDTVYVTNVASFTDSTITVKGTKPASLTLVITNGAVVSGPIVINGYTVTFAAGTVSTAV